MLRLLSASVARAPVPEPFHSGNVFAPESCVKRERKFNRMSRTSVSKRFRSLGVAHSLRAQPRQNTLPEPCCEPIEPPANARFVQPQRARNFGQRPPIQIIRRQREPVL